MIAVLKEWIRFDQHWSKALFLPVLFVANAYYRTKTPLKHIEFLSSIFRLNWPGTFWLVNREVTNRFLDQNRKIKENIYRDFLNDIDVIEKYKKFSDNPAEMLDGIVTIIAPSTKDSKGVLTIAYSYYFPLFLNYFDICEVEKHYHIVLEPSWNGLCDATILPFTRLNNEVFVMAYEDRDYQYIEALSSNLVPLKLSANWWISPEQFKQGLPIADRNIDIIMVAAWAKFKRHDRFFDAIRTLKIQGEPINVTLVGYPNDLNMNDIKQLAADYDISDQITFYEWISPEAVSDLLGRAKINIIWSRFEGLNRAIIEGMFCDTPCILRKGFNFGMEYPYINSQTGVYATEKGLAPLISYMLQNPQDYSPRTYVLEKHNCYVATTILADYIKKYDPSFDENSIVPKLSGLNGMEYLTDADARKFKSDYDLLKSLITPRQA